MEAGIKEGDVITSINGVKIKNGAMLSEQLSKYRPGDKIGRASCRERVCQYV